MAVDERSRTRELIRLARPEQWTKNAFVLAPVVFSGRLADPAALVQSVIAAAAFCLASSASYVVNDIVDRERDRRHPLKKDRPLAAGRVVAAEAAVCAAVLAVTAFAVAAALGLELAMLVAGFFAMQTGYSLVLKRIVVVDVTVIAAGFVLRAAGGVVAIGSAMSPWLLGCTFLLALFLALGKRRHEAVLLERDAAGHRSSLGGYGYLNLDGLVKASAVATVSIYVLYTFSPDVAEKLGTQRLWVTVPFVVFGVLRYLFLIYSRNYGGNPTDVLLRDFPLQAGIAAWGLSVLVLLYC